MRVALDIDGTISEHPEFFSFLSNALHAQGHEIIIITYRNRSMQAITEQQMVEWAIVYHQMHFVPTLADKGRLCQELAIDVFFEDMDECILPVGAHTIVFKTRNGFNFDFDGQQWII